MTGSFALYLGTAFPGERLPRLLMQSGLIMALGSLVMVFAFPAIGIHQEDNAGLWRGLWYEKNGWASSWSPRPRRRRPVWRLAPAAGKPRP